MIIIKKLLLILILFLFLISAVSAGENITDFLADESVENQVDSVITFNNDTVKTGESVEISLKSSDNTPITNSQLHVDIDNGFQQSVVTNDLGVASLKMDFEATNYMLHVAFDGNDKYLPCDEYFTVTVLGLDSKISIESDTVMTGKYFNVYLTDENSKPITNAEVDFEINSWVYDAVTDSNGKAGFKVEEGPGKYSLKIIYWGDEYYNEVSKTITLIIPSATSVTIGNNILLTNGYLRIYLNSQLKSSVSKKTLSVIIDGKTFTKTTNSEGIIVFNPKLGVGNHNITVKFNGSQTIKASQSSKIIKCIKGNVKDPLKKKIPLRNGVPDVDYMPKNYVMSVNTMTYTISKAQYLDVIKRDSYSLYLKNKLSKYTFFKSQSEPKLNHIIKREKWNVIEKEINYRIVMKNKHNYWPKSVTVNVGEYSYTYSEVLDFQNSPYTCGPTAGSMCSQVLKNYVCEKELAKKAGTTSSGTSPGGIKSALEKYKFKCSYYTKSTFNNALNQLKKGACALIFHAQNHYVAILDISSDGKKVLVGNSAGTYSRYSIGMESKWQTVKHMKSKFSTSDSTGLIVKLKYNLNKNTKKKINNFYSSMGVNWVAKNIKEIVW